MLSDHSLILTREPEGSARGLHRNCHTLEALSAESLSHPRVLASLSPGPCLPLLLRGRDGYMLGREGGRCTREDGVYQEGYGGVYTRRGMEGVYQGVPREVYPRVYLGRYIPGCTMCIGCTIGCTMCIGCTIGCT